MNNIDKIEYLIKNPSYKSEDYVALLELFDGPIRDYYDYLSTSPIDCDIELKKLDEADFHLCLVLLTVLLREDHFSDGSIVQRVKDGDVKRILMRVKELLSK